MLQQETSTTIAPRAELLGLSKAPEPQQVAEPCREPEAAGGARMLAEVLGNVLLGSVWLAALLAAPAVLGRLLGLI